MSYLANSNIYTATTDEIRAAFSNRIKGSRDALFLVISEKGLDAASEDALEKTAAALDYVHAAFAFIDGLDSTSLLRLIEGLDPRVMVLADKASAERVACAYQDKPLFNRTHILFGRPCAMFISFASLLETPQSKQRAWKLLKQLPPFGKA